MLERVVRLVYERLGRRYRLAFPLAQGPAVVIIATVAVVLLASYYDHTTSDLLATLIVAWVSSCAALAIAMVRGRPYMERVISWLESETPTPRDSALAWDARRTSRCAASAPTRGSSA